MTGPTTDRIAELEQGIAQLENQEAPLTPLGLSVLEARRAELARLRNEQPRDKTDEWDREHAKSRVIVQDENGRFKAIDKHTPSPAPSPEPQDVREKIARALYEQERKRGEHCNDILTGMMRKPIGGCSIEPWEECSETFLADADAVLAALAQSEPFAWAYRRRGFEGWNLMSSKPEFGDQYENMPLYTTPPSLPEGAREALEIIEAILEQAQDCVRGEQPEDMPDEEARIDTLDKIRNAIFTQIPIIRAVLASTTPSSAELVEAAEVLRIVDDALADAKEIATRDPEAGTIVIWLEGVRKHIEALRSRAADRSAPRSDKGGA